MTFQYGDNEVIFKPRTVQEIWDSVLLNYNNTYKKTLVYTTFLGTAAFSQFYPIVQELSIIENQFYAINEKIKGFYTELNTLNNIKGFGTNSAVVSAMAELGYQIRIRDNNVFQDSDDICIQFVGMKVSAQNANDFRNAIAVVCSQYTTITQQKEIPLQNPAINQISVAYPKDQTDFTDEDKRKIAQGLLENMPVGSAYVGSIEKSASTTLGSSIVVRFSPNVTKNIWLRLYVKTSRNNYGYVQTPEELKKLVLDNITARYKLGLDFEPEKYLTPTDIAWAGYILLEWTMDQPGPVRVWSSNVWLSPFNTLLLVQALDINFM
jgi:hypothetical protein